MTTSVSKDAVLVLAPEKGAPAYLSLGAHASLQAVYEAPDSPEFIRRTLSGALSWQLRNENTVIQAVRSPRLAPQFLAALLALGAEVLVGESARALLAGEGKLLADVLRQATPHFDSVSAVCVPLDVPGRAWGESRVARTPADAPIVMAIAVVDLDDSRGERAVVRQARLALTGAWREPARLAKSAELLVGDALGADRIQQVAAAVEQEVAPRDDFYGSADYRRAMSAVLTRRALEDCQRHWAGTGKE